MANRNLLHISKLKDFEEWLKKDGWTIEETKCLYEVLRARKDGRKKPLIIYTRKDSKEHLSMSDENVSVVNAFLKDNRKLQTNMDRIRTMSEEELAAVLMCPYDVDETSVGEKIPCFQDGRQELVTEEECRKCCINWLKSKVKE